MVPDLVDHFAQTLIRADLLEVAMPLIDSYARGVTHPVDEVVAEIDRRLQVTAEGGSPARRAMPGRGRDGF
ncbi:hypothetical protein AB0J43_27550 [Nonomuraea fuscirosea]